MDSAIDLRIGELAERAGCAVSAVRYYERVGLLDPPERVSGQRRYPASAVERLQVILLLRGTGLGIRDLAVALDCSPDGAQERRDRARHRAGELRAQIEDSRRALALLDHAAVCTSTRTDDESCGADVRRRLAEAGVTVRAERVGDRVLVG